MKALVMFVSGAVIFGITFFGWYWINALGCAMNTTGCRGVTLNWDDWETLQLFLPTFLLGGGLMATGAWVRFSRQRL